MLLPTIFLLVKLNYFIVLHFQDIHHNFLLIMYYTFYIILVKLDLGIFFFFSY